MKTVSRFLVTAMVAAGALAAPSAVRAQATATLCKDGTTSMSSGRGACTAHGGVDKAATRAAHTAVTREDKAAHTAAKATSGARVTLTCTDGTTSTATGRGACSGHGGVKAATAAAPGRAAVIAPSPSTAARTAAEARQPAPANRSVAASGGKDDNNPSGAIARCKDGLYSHAAHREGACSRHGGVATWLGGQ